MAFTEYTPRAGLDDLDYSVVEEESGVASYKQHGRWAQDQGASPLWDNQCTLSNLDFDALRGGFSMLHAYQLTASYQSAISSPRV